VEVVLERDCVFEGLREADDLTARSTTVNISDENAEQQDLT